MGVFSKTTTTSVTIDEVKPTHCNEHEPHPTKKPLTLQASFLISLSSILGGFCILLSVVWHTSQNSGGWNISNINHYVLVYGPTAVLVWIVAAWRQVDYHIKHRTPWMALTGGQPLVAHSLLLDYVSTFQLIALLTAVKLRHIPVILTILGFIALKLATLASTGLLVLEPVIASSITTGTTNTSFVGKTFDDSNSSTFDQSLLYTTYGILVQRLHPPFGLGQGLAYATPTGLEKLQDAANLTAMTVQAFVPAYECKAADIEFLSGDANTTDQFPSFNYTIQSPSCSLLARSPDIHTLNPQKYRCPDRQLTGVVQNINCEDSVFNASDGVYRLILLADMSYSQQLDASQADVSNSGPVQAHVWDTEARQLTGVICRTAYSIETVRLSAEANNIVESLNVQQLTRAGNQLNGFSDAALDRLFRGALSAGNGIFGDQLANAYALEYPDPTLKTMAAASEGTYESLLDTATMLRSAESVGNYLIAQIAHQYLRSNESSSSEIYLTRVETHLKVSTLATWLTFGAIGCAALFALALLASVYRSTLQVPLDTIAGILPWLKQNEALQSELLASQSLIEKELRNATKQTKVTYEHDFQEAGRLFFDQKLDLEPSTGMDQSWWHPITIHPFVLCVTFGLAASLIIVLQILQRLSDKHHGFIESASPTTNLQQLLTRLIPAGVFLGQASLFNCLDFNVLLLSPFNRTRKPATDDVLHNPSLLSLPPPLALYKALRSHNWGAAAASTAAMLGSAMAVVVSGLYAFRDLDVPQQVGTTALDQIVPAWEGSAVNDSGAALISSLTENLDFDYPVGTYEQIALPQIDLPDHSESINRTGLSVTLPAARAHLLCSSVPSSNLSLSTYSSNILNSATINATVALPPECALGGPNATDSTLAFVQTFNLLAGQNESYLGKILDLHVGPYDEVFGFSEGEREPALVNDNPLGCPSLAFIYGYVDLGVNDPDTANMKTVEVDLCYQVMQTVDTLFTFVDQNYTVSSSPSPNVNESTVIYTTMDNDNRTGTTADISAATKFQFRVQGPLDNTFVLFNGTRDNPFAAYTAAQRGPMDNFFQAVFFGRASQPLSNLKLESVAAHNDVKTGILSLYRRYMAQAISLNMRSPRTDAGSQQLVAHVPSATTQNRIVQDRTSKIVLQCMLAVMLVCGLFSVLTVRTRRLLPATANPCTIWGQMSIWAGSSILEKPTSGNEHRNKVHESSVRLGWWYIDNGRSRRYGIDSVSE